MTEGASYRRPLATLALLVLCWAAALLTLTGDREGLSARLFDAGSKENGAILDGQYWRLLSAPFLHGGWIHLLFNSYSLLVLGSLTEAVMGRARFLATYLVSAAAGSAASLAFNPDPSVGASGAIFGLLGAALYLSWRGHSSLIPRAQFSSLGLWAGYNLVFGFIQPNIDNAAHVGGLLAGTLSAALFGGMAVPLIVAAAGLGGVGWAAWEVVRSPRTAPQVTVFSGGYSQLEAGNRDSAEVLLRLARPFPPAYAMLALSRMQVGDPAAALANADTALSLMAADTRAARAYAMAAGAAGLDLDRARGQAELVRAGALLSLGRTEEALAAARQVSGGDPELRLRAGGVRGQALLLLGRPGEALEALMTPGDSLDRNLRAHIHSLRATALERLGRTAEAAGEARIAVRLAPGDLYFATQLHQLEGRPTFP